MTDISFAGKQQACETLQSSSIKRQILDAIMHFFHRQHLRQQFQITHSLTDGDAYGTCWSK